MDAAELTQHLADLGLDRHSSRALAMLPLVEVAWSDGEVQAAERKLILQKAEERLHLGEEGARILLDWLKYKPSASYFRRGHALLRRLAQGGDAGLDEAMLEQVLQMANDVAKASGGFLGWGGTSKEESDALARIADELSGMRAAPTTTQDDADRWGSRVTVMYDPDDDDEDFGPQVGGVLIFETAHTRQKHAVGDAPVVVGCGDDADLRVRGDHVAKAHCTVYGRRRRFYITESSPLAPVYVNGERIAERRLLGGETIRIGSRELTFKMGTVG